MYNAAGVKEAVLCFSLPKGDWIKKHWQRLAQQVLTLL
jgi:hypothetical protein